MGKLGGVVVAIAKTMEFTVTADGSEEVVLGLGGVSVNPNYQRRGFGAAVVGAAFARAEAESKRMLFQTGDALPLCKHHHPQPSRTPPALPTQLHSTPWSSIPCRTGLELTTYRPLGKTSARPPYPRGVLGAGCHQSRLRGSRLRKPTPRAVLRSGRLTAGSPGVAFRSASLHAGWSDGCVPKPPTSMIQCQTGGWEWMCGSSHGRGRR